MTHFIALLRAVNVAGHQKVVMADLRGLLGELGFEEPRSILASGNLVFRAGDRTTAELEEILEGAARARLGLDTDFFVRSADEWSDVVAANPFPAEAEEDPGRLLVYALKEAPVSERVEELQRAIPGREVVGTVRRHAYIVYPDGIGRSRLSSALIERKLGTRGTGRNWNTVLKLQAATLG